MCFVNIAQGGGGGGWGGRGEKCREENVKALVVTEFELSDLIVFFSWLQSQS